MDGIFSAVLTKNSTKKAGPPRLKSFYFLDQEKVDEFVEGYDDTDTLNEVCYILSGKYGSLDTNSVLKMTC